MHPYKASNHKPIDKKNKPFTRFRTVLDELLDKPCQIHTTPSTEPMHSLQACWVLRQVAKSGEAILTSTTPEKHSSEDDDLNVFTVFETFSSNNRRKRALRELAEVNQVIAVNPWNDTAITFMADDEPRARSVRAPAALVLNPKCSWTAVAGLTSSTKTRSTKCKWTRTASSKALPPFEALSPVEKHDARGKLNLM
jgi:hypothetical protein